MSRESFSRIESSDKPLGLSTPAIVNFSVILWEGTQYRNVLAGGYQQSSRSGRADFQRLPEKPPEDVAVALCVAGFLAKNADELGRAISQRLLGYFRSLPTNTKDKKLTVVFGVPGVNEFFKKAVHMVMSLSFEPVELKSSQAPKATHNKSTEKDNNKTVIGIRFALRTPQQAAAPGGKAYSCNPRRHEDKPRKPEGIEYFPIPEQPDPAGPHGEPNRVQHREAKRVQLDAIVRVEVPPLFFNEIRQCIAMERGHIHRRTLTRREPGESDKTSFTAVEKLASCIYHAVPSSLLLSFLLGDQLQQSYTVKFKGGEGKWRR